MKKLLAATAIFATCLATSEATILITDAFPTDGNLVGTTPAVGGTWTNISGATTPLVVTSGTLAIPNANAQDAASQFAAAQTGVIYAGFDLRLTTLPSLTAPGSYIAAFRDGTPSTGDYAGRFFVRRVSGSPANEFQIGVSTFTGGLDDPGAVIWSTNLTLNTEYRIVMGFDTSTDNTTLWVNPTSIASPSITSSDVHDVIAMDGFSFRSSSQSHGAAAIDDLIVATTFGEAIPEPSTCLMFGLGAGLVMWRMRGRSKK